MNAYYVRAVKDGRITNYLVVHSSRNAAFKSVEDAVTIDFLLEGIKHPPTVKRLSTGFTDVSDTMLAVMAALGEEQCGS